MNPSLVDIGVNLTHKSFRSDRDQVVARASARGVTTLIVTGTSLANSREGQKLAGGRPGTLYATAGVHPHNARECDADTIGQLRQLAGNPEVVAIGECGLDYNRDFSPRPVQDRWFEAQIELAFELGMPLFLHERDAHQRFLEILSAHRDRIPSAVVHCFTGSAEELKAYLDLDFHIGITGWFCDDRRGKHLRTMVRDIPPNRLMLETDAPFLTPRTMPSWTRDGRNEPSYLPFVLQMVSDCLKKPAEEVAQFTTDTARAFFKIG
jgi:TatD DNase family protein